MSVKIALAGNPNSGKTTLFNALTGANQFVGNWPGVTVEKKEGKWKGNKEIIITDLPGIYSLSPYTLEEVVARKYLLEEKPDGILNIIDGTNLERNLYLTTQLIELGIPMVIAVNMMDVVEKNGDKIDIQALSKELGCPVVEISALKGKGVMEAAETVVQAAKAQKAGIQHKFTEAVEAGLEEISEKLQDIPDEKKRFFSIKLFERDEEIVKEMKTVPAIEDIIQRIETELDDDSESIITNERYTYIADILQHSYHKKNKGQLTTSDKIDRVVTNRWAALPIFAVVMFIVYYVSVTTIGTFATDWTNDGLFGDGFFLFGNGREAFDEATEEYEMEMAKVDAFLEAAADAGIDTNQMPMEVLLEEAADVKATVEVTDEEGNVTETIPVDAAAYSEAITAEEPAPEDFGTWISGIPVVVDNALSKMNVAGWLHGLIVDGIIGGVGAVLGFVPQMLVLFIFLAFLEGCGYMARIAFIMDRIFRKFGLSGKSFIPMLIGTGCGVPGIMASRTIENERDRRMTIMTTTFIPCGAKLPIIALIAGALFQDAPWVAPSAYFVGILAIIISGIILKKTMMFSGDPAPFVMELPAYHMPTVGSILRSMWERGSSFIKKAGTIILLSAIVIWFLENFGFTPDGFGMVEDLNSGLLANIGSAIAWIFAPLGWGQWQSAVATITGLVAKENVVGTFGVLFGFAEVAENGVEYWGTLSSFFTPAAAYSFLVFNLLCAPCFAAIGAIKREMNSPKWTWFAILYQTIFAYLVAFCVYQIGSLILGTGSFGIGVILAIVVIIGFLYFLFRKPKQK